MSRLERLVARQAETITEGRDPAVQLGNLLDKGQSHIVFKDLNKKRDALDTAVANAKKILDGYRKAGVGETNNQDIVKEVVLPALKAFRDSADKASSTIEKMVNAR